MLTPVSEVSASDLVALSPPQVSPSSQVSEAGSDAGAAEVPEVAEAGGTTAELCSETASNEEPRADEDKDPKKSKAHLHCPVCKVTVNSVSQLEAHNSGTSFKVGDVEEETAASSGYSLDCSVVHSQPPPELVSELLLHAYPNLETSSTFFLVGLCEDASSHHVTRCQIVHTGLP